MSTKIKKNCCSVVVYLIKSLTQSVSLTHTVSQERVSPISCLVSKSVGKSATVHVFSL